MDARAVVRERIEQHADRLIALSHRIHAHPEVAFEEVHASGWLSQLLTEAGLAVTAGVGGLDTAFTARAGSGPLHVAICAEYDALPGIGHACGHNIIAAAAAGAGIGLAEVADDLGLTVTVVGTPAEEQGGGKIILLSEGVFDGVHAAMMVHPSPFEMALMPSIAVHHFEVRYTGKEAHASAFPELGVNAADALTVAQVGIGLLRQHMRPTDRVHGIVTKGGDAANIVPAHAGGVWMVRAATVDDLAEIRDKVYRCFHAGALATGADLEIDPEPSPYAQIEHDQRLAEIYRRGAEELGRSFIELTPELERAAGSTDMGNVSLAMPAIHPTIAIDSLPAVNHQPEFTAACATPSADKATIDGAIAMAWTAVEAATDDAVRARLLAAGRVKA
jgi:amidohydrolase